VTPAEAYKVNTNQRTEYSYCKALHVSFVIFIFTFFHSVI